jgi:cytochrome b561
MGIGQKTKYSGLAMALHWLVGIAVIVSWRIAEAAEAAPTRELRSEIMGNHFALGVVIFSLVALRFVWRMLSPPPPPSPHHAAWERVLARVTHGLIYTLLLVMPLAGWFAMSKYGAGISLWGAIEVPPLPVAPDDKIAEQVFETHAVAGTILLVLIAVHVLGTLKHTLIDRDGTIFRMLPFGEARN